jgi:guanylate kinase
VEEEEEEPPIEYPEPVTLSEVEFEEAVSSGRLLEHHADLFVHEMAKHRHGTSADAIKEVIMSGKLPLLELEAEGAAAIKARGIDCLTIFLRPPSEQVFADRVTSWLTESDEEISARMERAQAQVGHDQTQQHMSGLDRSRCLHPEVSSIYACFACKEHLPHSSTTTCNSSTMVASQAIHLGAVSHLTPSWSSCCLHCAFLTMTYPIHSMLALPHPCRWMLPPAASCLT